MEEERKVYISKLPKDCKTCPFQCYGECKNGCDILKTDYSMTQCHILRGKSENCPLHSTSELVKEVCEEIRNEFEWNVDDLVNEFAEIEDCKFVEIGDVNKILQKVLKKYGVGGENEGK